MTNKVLLVPICIENYEKLPYLYFDSRYKSFLCQFEDIHLQIFLAKLHENPDLLRAVDSVLGTGNQQNRESPESTAPSTVRFS